MGITRVTDKEKAFLAEIGQRLADLQEKNIYSCADIVSNAGCSAKHIAEVEKGLARLTAYQLKVYCSMLHVTPNEVMGFGTKKTDILNTVENAILSLLL